MTNEFYYCENWDTFYYTYKVDQTIQNKDKIDKLCTAVSYSDDWDNVLKIKQVGQRQRKFKQLKHSW